MFAFVLIFLPCLAVGYEVLFALNSGNYEKKMISTKFFNYTSDMFFETGTSMPARKTLVPDSLVNPADQDLVRSHRTTAINSLEFAYKSTLKEGHYLAIFTFVETQFKNRGERVFNLKFGDDIVHTVDIFAEAGYGKILHKWIEFQIKEDVAFFNDSLPGLNAYNYKTKEVRFVFQTVAGNPKVEAYMLIKGNDAHQYLKEFLLHEQQKNTIPKEYISSKYRRQPQLSYRPLEAKDVIPPPKSEFQRLYKKFVCFKSLGCIFCGIFAIHYQKIFLKLDTWYQSLLGLFSKLSTSEQKKDKKQ